MMWQETIIERASPLFSNSNSHSMKEYLEFSIYLAVVMKVDLHDSPALHHW